MKSFAIPAVFILATTVAFSAARAQHAHDAGQPVANGPYSPGLGEIMTLQQMRHSKLWFAGNARNWELADYELDELKEGFDDVAKLFPTVNGVAVAPDVDAIAEKELTELAKAVESKDRSRFAAGFDKLTAACNACHQTTKHAFISIQRPTSLPYSNQSFDPPRQSPTTQQTPRSGGHQH